MYLMQLPNLNTPVYVPRTVRFNNLKKVNEIAVDLSPLLRTNSSGSSYMYVPSQEPSQLVSALWLSAVIGFSKLNVASGVEFLGQTELNFAESALTRKDYGFSTTNIYDLVKLLDSVSKTRGYRCSLSKVNKWTDVLLALMEGHAVMVGGTEYESFKEAELTGLVPMPKPGEALLEGQIFNLVSFDQEKDMALIVGNRGMKVGKRGLFQCRASYLRNLNICRDFFVLLVRKDHAGR